MTKRKYVDVNVSWCNDECSPTAKLSLDSWEDVLRGEEVDADTTYWYGGKKYEAIFVFNRGGRGNLRVFYYCDKECVVGFEGRISEATITGGEYPHDSCEPVPHIETVSVKTEAKNDPPPSRREAKRQPLPRPVPALTRNPGAEGAKFIAQQSIIYREMERLRRLEEGANGLLSHRDRRVRSFAAIVLEYLKDMR